MFRFRVLAVASAVALVASVVGVVWGGTTQNASASTTSSLKVVTIGDSIMSGHGLQASQAWPELIAASDGVDITNVACSGAGFVAVGSCGTDFEGLIPEAVAAQPTLVIVESSDNDLHATADEIQTATTTTIDAIHSALPNAKIVAFNTLWDQPGNTPDEVAISTDALRTAVRADGGIALDLGQPLAGHAALLQSDSEHPTVLGQQVLARDVQLALAAADIVL